jgi:drug/metabolite transporter (DMT)-like permease
MNADRSSLRGPETLGMALGLVGVAIFAATLPLTRVALSSFGPVFLTAARAAIAGLIAIPVLVAGGRPIPWSDARTVALAALLLAAGFPGFTSLAMRELPAAHAGVIVGALPLATVAASALIEGERPSAAFWAAAVAGAAVVVGFALHHGGESLRGGDALLLLAVASAAVGYTLSARLARRMPPGDVISWVVVVSLPVSLALTIAWRPAEWSAPTPAAWASLAYLGAMSMYLGFFAWNAGLALGGVARVSQVQLLQTFLTIAIAAALLGERIDAETMVCAALIVALAFVGRRLRAQG